MSGRKMYLCALCRRHVSVTAGTIFQGNKIPLRKWFRAIWLVTNQKNGINAKELQMNLRLASYKSAWMVLGKMRKAMVREKEDILSGKVEVDEVYFGKRRSRQKSRSCEEDRNILIMVMVQFSDVTRHRRIRLLRVDDASAETLEKVIKKAVKEKSEIQTDGLGSYKRLENLGYIHKVIRERTAVGYDLLPYCNRISVNLKKWLTDVYRGNVSNEHLDYYLDEFTFRYNHRFSRYGGKLFHSLLWRLANTNPVNNL